MLLSIKHFRKTLNTEKEATVDADAANIAYSESFSHSVLICKLILNCEDQIKITLNKTMKSCEDQLFVVVQL